MSSETKSNTGSYWEEPDTRYGHLSVLLDEAAAMATREGYFGAAEVIRCKAAEAFLGRADEHASDLRVLADEIETDAPAPERPPARLIDGAHRVLKADDTPTDPPMPKIVCLCGSTRFKREFIEANFKATMSGKIVLTVGWFGHADGDKYTPTPEEKDALDELHKRKIDLADEVLVINVGGYIGESTRSEIEYAESIDRPVKYLEGVTP